MGNVSNIKKVCKRCGQNDRDPDDGRCKPCRRQYRDRQARARLKPTTWTGLACDGRIAHERLRDMRDIEDGPDYSLDSIKI